MRVLYLTLNPNRESTTVPTEGWFRLLGPKGLEPILVSSQSGAFQKWAAEQRVPCYDTPLPFPNSRWPIPFLRAVWRVVRIGRKHRVQLVHCNEHDVYPVGQYAARLLGVPVVVSVHFTLRDGFSPWAFGGSRQPARMFFVSRSCLEACRPDVAGAVSEDRWRVLYNAVNLTFYRPDASLRAQFRREHRLESAFVLGAACALRPRKNLEHLFDLAAQLPSSVRVALAGGPVPGDEEYAANLLKEASARLGNRLVYIGHQRDLRAIYNGMDLFVNTSHEESFGLSVLEAMACGCPVVGYPSVSVGEVVLPGGGEIVPQGDLPSLAAATARYVAAPDLANAREQARRRAEHFDIALIADELWKEYGELVR